MDFKQKQHLAEPNIIHSELNSAIRDSSRAVNRYVLEICLLRYFSCKQREGESGRLAFDPVFCMPNQESGKQANVTLVIVGLMKKQIVQERFVPFIASLLNMQNMLSSLYLD